MDEFTSAHLVAWISQTVVGLDEQVKTHEAICTLLHDHPDLVGTQSWPEIRHLATRESLTDRYEGG
ncbi:hypothetical protein LCGC14_1258590 [marine sediment metagenome]|uniref:Uncharacterized protein n=1 Tax=marine sediment metagenome TaxID=412755 RepID=A0A0F9L1C9_9ZZZZ